MLFFVETGFRRATKVRERPSGIAKSTKTIVVLA
jgi:hypothetical protein